MAVVKATIFGANGFIGSRLVSHLTNSGIDCAAIGRGGESWQTRDLGHVFYCIGLTADFRSRPLDAIDAHVGYLERILRHARFESLLYLSSTRVYLGADSTSEDATLRANPNNPDDLYNFSKLLGEAACLAQSNPAVRVARLSNVYGPGMGSTNFLGAIIRDALSDKRIVLNSAPESEKDYISVDAVVQVLTKIGFEGRERLYNVARGRNTTHREIIDKVAELTKCAVQLGPQATAVKFRPIDITRLRALVSAEFSNVTDDLHALVDDARATSLISR